MKKIDADMTGALVETIGRIISADDAELFALKDTELRAARFHWEYDSTLSMARTAYEFYQCLALYARACERWESHHNGYVCVVERVREKYLMPEINNFLKIHQEYCTKDVGFALNVLRNEFVNNVSDEDWKNALTLADTELAKLSK